MDYDAIEQEALNLPLEERDYLESLLWQSLKGLSPEEIERGDALNPAQMSAVMKNAESTIEKKKVPLIQAALCLPAGQRDELACLLLQESFPGERVTGEEWEKAWAIEIELRVREMDAGKAKSIPWEEVKRKGRELLGEL